MPTLSEIESKRLIAHYGVPVLDERTAGDPDGAVAAAQELGFPVVAKLCGDAIAHKTERGLVRLGLRDAGAVRAAAIDLLAAARPDDGPVEVLVAPMLRGTRELMPAGSLLLRSGTMTVIIGQPIATLGLSDEDRANLNERVRGIVETMLRE